MPAKKPKSGGVSVDFTGVEAGGARAIPDGEYVFVVEEVSLETSQDSGQDYIKWQYKVKDGKYKGARLWDNTSLQPQALWKLRQVLEAMGVEIPEGAMDLELEEYVDMEVGIVVENEKYQGKDKPRAAGYFPAEDDGASSDPAPAEDPPPEEKPAAKKKAVKAAPEFTVGQKVSFTDDGEEYTGKITKVEDDTATVKVGKDEWEIDVGELTAA